MSGQETNHGFLYRHYPGHGDGPIRPQQREWWLILALIAMTVGMLGNSFLNWKGDDNTRTLLNDHTAEIQAEAHDIARITNLIVTGNKRGVSNHRLICDIVATFPAKAISPAERADCAPPKK